MGDIEENQRFIQSNNGGPPSPVTSTTSFTSELDTKQNVYEESASDYVGLYVCVGILQVVGIVAIVLSVVWSNDYLHGFSWDGSGTNFNWHTVCMTLFIFMYGNGVLVYRLARRMEKMNAKIVHSAVNGLALLFAVTGLAAVFRFHNHLNIPNVYSVHSWIGLGTVTLYACQVRIFLLILDENTSKILLLVFPTMTIVKLRWMFCFSFTKIKKVLVNCSHSFDLTQYKLKKGI